MWGTCDGVDGQGLGFGGLVIRAWIPGFGFRAGVQSLGFRVQG